MKKKILILILITIFFVVICFVSFIYYLLSNHKEVNNQPYKLVPAGDMNLARYKKSLTLLKDGSVLVVGGDTKESSTTAEIFDPNTKQFRLLKNQTIVPHTSHDAYLLDNGKVIIIGNTGIELFDPVTETFRLVNKMITPRINCETIKLPDGNILIWGGTKYDKPVKKDDYITPTKEVLNYEIYNPNKNAIKEYPLSKKLKDLYYSKIILNPQGKLFMITANSICSVDLKINKTDCTKYKLVEWGGIDSVINYKNKLLFIDELSNLYLYDYTNKKINITQNKSIFSVHDSYNEDKKGKTSLTLLRDGKIAVIRDAYSVYSYLEIYDPIKNKTYYINEMRDYRSGGDASIVLDNGDLLIPGGIERTKIVDILTIKYKENNDGK